MKGRRARLDQVERDTASGRIDGYRSSHILLIRGPAGDPNFERRAGAERQIARGQDADVGAWCEMSANVSGTMDRSGSTQNGVSQDIDATCGSQAPHEAEAASRHFDVPGQRASAAEQQRAVSDFRQVERTADRAAENEMLRFPSIHGAVTCQRDCRRDGTTCVASASL